MTLNCEIWECYWTSTSLNFLIYIICIIANTLTEDCCDYSTSCLWIHTQTHTRNNIIISGSSCSVCSRWSTARRTGLYRLQVGSSWCLWLMCHPPSQPASITNKRGSLLPGRGLMSVTESRPQSRMATDIYTRNVYSLIMLSWPRRTMSQHQAKMRCGNL